MQNKSLIGILARVKQICRVQSVIKWGYAGILGAFFWGGFFSAEAQNNPYKIKDKLYPIFQRATKYRVTTEGLRVADTLFTEAVRLNDKKAQCLALTIPTYYYVSVAKYGELQQACDRLRSCARKNGYLQYFYFAYSQEIIFLLNQKRSMSALQKVEEMKNKAFDDNHPYGIFTSFRTAGHIYTVRSNFQMALGQYQMALDYARENLPDQSLTPIYLNMAVTYNSLRNYSESLKYVQLALETSQTDENRVAARQAMCTVLYDMGEKEKFNECYEQCMQDMRQYGVIQQRNLKLLHIKKCILNGEYEQARNLLNDSSIAITQRLDFQCVIYEAEGDYKNALDGYKRRRVIMDSISNEMQASDMTELIVQIGNEQLKLKAKSLELNNTKLKLEQATTQSLYEKSEVEKKMLALENHELELARLKAESEKKELALKEAETISEHKIVSLTLVVLLLTVIIGFLIFYLRRRRILMADMARKNEELRVARDQAEQADRMKTVFIQNMSHEIRTPLNSIVGFSQLLSSSDIELGEEEKREFSSLIQHNSDLLTTLVNDVLDLASLESGQYTMEITPCSCNELGEISIATVMHRKAEGVNLYFTSDLPDDYKIRTDGNRVKQVLINFLTNAEKYTEQGEIHLHCSLSENPGFVTYSVSDTGPGIPSDMADAIFERFKKLNEFKQGTGLGLNICRIVAERLHGKVKVDKSYTGGARFLFILPLSETNPDR